MVLNWMENLREEEIPPRWMWHLGHEVGPWFERIREERDRDASGEAPMSTNQDPTAEAVRKRVRR
jgi:hypothetical protein